VQLDNLAAETAAYRTTNHPDYAVLAARIAISNLQKQTKPTFSEVIEDLHGYVDPKSGRNAKMIDDKIFEIVMANKDRLNSAIVHSRDFTFT